MASPQTGNQPRERESLRHALRSSLNEILGDVALDAQNMRQSQTAAGSSSPSRREYPSTLFNRVPPFTAVPPNSLIAQSLGLSASPFSTSSDGRFICCGNMSFNADDVLISAATAAIADSRLLAQGRALLIRKQLTEEKNRISQYSFITALRNQMVNESLSHSLLPSKKAFHSTAEDANISEHEKISQTLQALGTNLRSRKDPYIDVSSYLDPVAGATPASARARGGVAEPFPPRLHRMLREVEQEGNADIVSFYSHGRAFAVHDMERFCTEIMPKFFKQTKWNSFARQLNLYGKEQSRHFVRVYLMAICT